MKKPTPFKPGQIVYVAYAPQAKAVTCKCCTQIKWYEHQPRVERWTVKEVLLGGSRVLVSKKGRSFHGIRGTIGGGFPASDLFHSRKAAMTRATEIAIEATNFSRISFQEASRNRKNR